MGRAGARQAADDDRPLDHDVVRFGVPLQVIDDEQAVPQQLQKVVVGTEPAERAKTRFGVERSQAHLVRFVVQLVAEVVETRLGNRVRREHREIERQRRRKVAHALAHRDDVVGQLRRGQIVNMDRGRSAVHGAPLPRSHVRTPDRRRPRLGPTG